MGELGIILFIAFGIGIFYLVKLRNYDIYDKEPKSILFVSFLVGGIVSIIVTALLYTFVELEHTFFQAFYKVGIIEELGKLITFFLIYKMIRKHFDEIVDGVIYMSSIALGFAVIENISYALTADNAISMLAIRAVTSTIGHMAFSGIMGIALFIHFRVHKNWGGIFIALLIAAFAHGFYDGVLFKPEFTWSFIFVYALIVISAWWVIRLVLSFSNFRKPFQWLAFEPTTNLDPILCVNCGTKERSLLYTFWKINSHKCSNCNNLVFDFKYWKEVNRYYLPLRSWRKVKNGYKNSKTNPVLFGNNLEHKVDAYVEMVSCASSTLTSWLDAENKRDKMKVLKKPIIGWLLKEIGLKYMI